MFRVDISGIYLSSAVGYLSPQQLADQYKCQPFVARERHFAAYLADPYKNFTIAHPDRMIYPNIWIKCYVDRRNGLSGVIPPERLDVKSGYIGRIRKKIQCWLVNVRQAS